MSLLKRERFPGLMRLINNMSSSIGISTSFYCHDGQGNWLFHKRSEQCRDERLVWDCGGGKLEFGLSLEENVLKEIREEYCCGAQIQEQLPAITLLRQSPENIKTHWLIIPFILYIDGVNKKMVQRGDKEKMIEIGWFRFDALPQPIHSGFTKTLAQYGPRFQKYLTD